MLFNSRTAKSIAVTLLFLTALVIRLYDLTDLPFDFHPTRQMLSIIRARGLYFATQPGGIPTWQLEAGIRHAALKADIEPVIFERLVTFTYQFTGEQIWVARIYSSIFWLIGAAFLFMLVRDLVSFEGALVSTAYFLLFPYAVIASRSFQPDPLMVALMISFWWMLLRWITLTLNPSPTGRGAGVRAAILAGLLGGLAIFIKFPAVFFVAGGALGLLFGRFTFREMIRNTQVWVIAVSGALLPLGYVIYGVFIRGTLGGEFSGNFVPSLFLSPLNYLLWETKASLAAGGVFIMLGLLGLLVTKDKTLRSFLSGMWIAYIVFGMYFNYHAGTHDYYHLPLLPIVAVSLSPLGAAVLARLTESASSRWMRSAVYVILIYGMLSVVWDVRNQLKSVDYRPEAAMWSEIGEALNYESNAIALTEDYGSRLEYFGWTHAAVWPASGDIYASNLRGSGFDFEKEFARRTRSSSFFVVTDFKDLSLQTDLETRLEACPIFAQGDGYVIYDLENR